MGKFKCLISRSTHFRSIINSMKEIADHVNFDCNSEGIYIQGMDSAKVALMDLNLDVDYFEEFEVNDNDEEVISLGIDLKVFSAIMKCINSADELELEGDTDKGKLSITIKNDNRKNEFEMNLMDIEQENMDVPDIEHEYIIKAEPKELMQYITNMTALGVDDVVFQMKKNSAKMQGKSDHVKINLELVNNENVDDLQDASKITFSKSSDEDLSMAFSIVYIQKFMKASPVSKKVAMCFTDSIPMFMQFQFEGGNLNYYLAPRIEDD